MAFMRQAAVAIASLGLLGTAGCMHHADRGGSAVYGAGGGGFSLNPFHGRGGGGGSNTSTAAIGVNSYLWRASLDTIAFMPLASADPYGGIINTDWYVSPEQPTERFKVTIYILDTRLRADGLNVTVFKQVKDLNGGWTDAPTADQTATDIENAILTRARQLRLSSTR